MDKLYFLVLFLHRKFIKEILKLKITKCKDKI